MHLSWEEWSWKKMRVRDVAEVKHIGVTYRKNACLYTIYN